MTATVERNWTEVGAKFTGPDDRERVERAFAGLTWEDLPADGSPLEMGFMPGEAIKACIRELGLPKVSMVAADGYLSWPDVVDGHPAIAGYQPETAHYAVYGIEANYKQGRVRVYLLDSGTEILPLLTELYRGERHPTFGECPAEGS